MAFDCYCAICGVGFSGLRIGTPSDATAERRQQYVQSISRSPDGARYRTPSDEESIHSYDPRLVDSDSIAWTSKVHCLGLHEVEGKTTAFVSGPGYYSDAGEMAVKLGNRIQRTYFSCYGFGTDTSPGPVIPFHWCCFEILLRSLTGSTDVKNVNLDVLYDAMMSLCNQAGSALRLNYGEDVAQGQGQYWRCLPGVEYTVHHPTNTPILTSFLRSQVQLNKSLHVSSSPSTSTPKAGIDLGTRELKNPFSTLPAELIYQIASFLPGESLKNLIQASPYIYALTRDDYFWRRFIESDMPWLWEGDVLRKSKANIQLESTSDENLDIELDHKQVYIWLNAITKPSYGMENTEIMGIANRRRIWGACEDVVKSYRGLCQ
ncbi:F-box protein [Aspergillus stella-maris]|uniref:F-box protein n=1 Tax=Aspergillus stella-maris TaxID=1810926 RepID=UPI003CCD21B4